MSQVFTQNTKKYREMEDLKDQRTEDRRLHWIVRDDKVGYVNAKGGEVIPCRWHGQPHNFSEGLAAVTDANGLAGYINHEGELVIPCQWKQCHDFAEGCAIVRDTDDRPCIIDTSGKVIFPNPKGQRYSGYKLIETIVYAQSYRHIGKKTYLGKEVEYLELFDVSDDVVGVEMRRKGADYLAYGYWSRRTRKLIQAKDAYRSKGYYREGLRRMTSCHISTAESWDGFVDKKNRLVIPYFFSFATHFSEGLAAGLRIDWYDSLYCYFNKKGHIVIPYKWQSARPFHEGLAAVAERTSGKEKWGFIDKTGELVIPCLYDEVEDFCNGTAWVNADGMWEVIDKEGHQIFL